MSNSFLVVLVPSEVKNGGAFWSIEVGMVSSDHLKSVCPFVLIFYLSCFSLNVNDRDLCFASMALHQIPNLMLFRF